MEIKKGDVLIRSKPFVYRMLEKYHGLRCENCLKRNSSLKKCAKCKRAFYCNKECQAARWIDHKFDCAHMSRICQMNRKFDPEAMYVALFLAKICRKEQSGVKESETFGNVTRTFADLRSYSRQIRADIKEFLVAKGVWFSLLELGLKIQFDEFFEIYGKVKANWVFIKESFSGHGIAVALYLGPSLLKHSCCPNTFVVFEGPHMIVTSMEDLAECDMSKVSLSSIHVFDRKEVRQKALLEQRFFCCKCSWCEDETLDKKMRSVCCGNFKCDEPVFILSDECSTCKTPVKPNSRAKAHTFMDKLHELSVISRKQIRLDHLSIGGMYARDSSLENLFRDLENVLLKSRSVLHPLNIDYVNGAKDAMETSFMLTDFQNSLAYGLVALRGYRAYSRDVTPELATLLGFVGMSALNCGFCEEGRRNIQEALYITVKLFGSESEHARKLCALLM